MALRAQKLDIKTFSVRRPGEEHSVGPEQRAEREQTIYLLPLNLVFLVVAHLSILITSPRRYWRSLRLAGATSQPGIKGLLYQAAYFLEAGLLAYQIRQRQIMHLHNHIASSSCTVAMLAAELGNFSYSFTMHGPHIFFEPYRWRLSEKIKRAAFVVCISHFCRSQGMVFADPEDWNKMHVIHCGVEPDLFEAIKPQLSNRRLLYVGRLASEKGLPILLECLSQLVSEYPDLLLTVVGDGSDRSWLEKRVADLELDNFVQFVGYQSQENVRKYLKDTDVFVLPSFAEGVPVVLMEAMAAGVPVVATRVAGISELVEDQVNGLLVTPGNPESLRQSLRKILSSPNLRQQLSHRSKATIQKEFDITKESAKLKVVMEKYALSDFEASYS